MPMSMNEPVPNQAICGVSEIFLSSLALPSIYMLIGTSSSSSCQDLDCCLFHLNKFICIRNENLYSETLYLRKHTVSRTHTHIRSQSHSPSPTHMRCMTSYEYGYGLAGVVAGAVADIVALKFKLYFLEFNNVAGITLNRRRLTTYERHQHRNLPTNATTNDNNPEVCRVCWRKIYSRTSFSFVFVS